MLPKIRSTKLRRLPDQVEDGVSQELQALVGFDAFFIDGVDIGTVLERLGQQRRVGKGVSQLLVKSIQRFFAFVCKPMPELMECFS